ncbi:MAG: TetR family transcriptional regulator, partial [Actinomycetales bacterium]|nr:TetR family transcriptional regulator [Actinomycetales bacterium]
AMPATLVVHDRRDKETSFAVGERLAHAWPTADLLATDGLGHQRILADGEVVAAVADHVTGTARATSTGQPASASRTPGSGSPR